MGPEGNAWRGPRRMMSALEGAGPVAERPNDLGFCCASNMAAPRSEVQAELCGPSGLPKRQLQTLVRRLADICLPGQNLNAGRRPAAGVCLLSTKVE
jgi:hypothetical protein